MISALEIGAGVVLTAPLLIVATVLAAVELGRLATGDDEQRQIEVAGLLRIRKAVRPARVVGARDESHDDGGCLALFAAALGDPPRPRSGPGGVPEVRPDTVRKLRSLTNGNN